MKWSRKRWPGSPGNKVVYRPCSPLPNYFQGFLQGKGCMGIIYRTCNLQRMTRNWMRPLAAWMVLNQVEVGTVVEDEADVPVC